MVPVFIQVIQGRTKDAEGLRRQIERWQSELKPGAKGYLGSTGGVADDGTAIVLARFESEQAAQANSERPEQGAWWSETSKYFDGEVTFRNYTETDQLLAGGSDSAGFVQVMQGRSTDRARQMEVEKQAEQLLKDARPDLIGSIRGWDGDNFTEAIYFTSEAEARAGEKRMGEQDMPAEFAEFMTLMQDVTYIDLKDPWLQSA